MYVIMYAKIMVSKKSGILSHSVHFGGIEKSEDDAEGIAQSCVRNNVGYMVIPKVVKVDSSVQQAIKNVNTYFVQLIGQMYSQQHLL